MITTGHSQQCFFCRHQIDSLYAVQWDGYSEGESIPTTGLYLHPDCAVMLGIRLIGDGFPNQSTEKETILMLVKNRCE